jgi:hypothetical protein
MSRDLEVVPLHVVLTTHGDFDVLGPFLVPGGEESARLDRHAKQESD